MRIKLRPVPGGSPAYKNEHTNVEEMDGTSKFNFKDVKVDLPSSESEDCPEIQDTGDPFDLA